MNIFVTNIYLFLLAIVFAVLEIQIEGKNGWASKLPTWTPKKDSKIEKLFSIILGGRDVTGYHLSMFLLVFLIFQFPFLFESKITFLNVLIQFSLYLQFIVIWDFLWFILNPYFRISKFKKENIFWHKVWLGPFPVDYYALFIVSFLILLPIKNVLYLKYWMYFTLLYFIEIIVTILCAEQYYNNQERNRSLFEKIKHKFRR